MIMVDIDMPKNCYECDFNGGEYGPDYPEKCSCKLTGRGMSKKDYKKRPKDCPLKNVPLKHNAGRGSQSDCMLDSCQESDALNDRR